MITLLRIIVVSVLCVVYWLSLWGNILSPLGVFIILLAARNILCCTTPVSCRCEVNISTLVRPRTHAQMFINFYSVQDPYVQMCCGSADVSGADQGGHVAGFTRILTFKYVCFSMSVTSLLCFHNVHLVQCPSVALAGEKHHRPR